MIYILETKLPENKSVKIALTSIYGIGHSTSQHICKKLGFSTNLKIKSLTEEQTVEILKIIEFLKLTTTNELKQLKSQNFKTLIEIKCYKGLRRSKGLPVRGQRTHTKAKSAKRNKLY